SFTIPYVFELALNPNTPGGTIVTPLLPRIPLLFVAGYLAGRQRKLPKELSDIEIRQDQGMELLPAWWYPYSKLAEWHIGETLQPHSILTNFSWRLDDDETSDLKSKIETGQRAPKIVEFLAWLQATDRSS
ncbi:MAG: hypothetical protein JXB07_04430, partial [Anaerolineae bacterium]|nr:hypothetical protein [Anaerolineae bacterium]